MQLLFGVCIIFVSRADFARNYTKLYHFLFSISIDNFIVYIFLTIIPCPSEMKMVLPRPWAGTAAQLMGVEAYKNGILTKALDLPPRNNQVILPADSEKSVASSDNQRQDLSIILIKLKISGIAKPCTITQVDDFEMAQVNGTVSLHCILPSAFKDAFLVVYAIWVIHLAVRFKMLPKKMSTAQYRKGDAIAHTTVKGVHTPSSVTFDTSGSHAEKKNNNVKRSKTVNTNCHVLKNVN